MMYSKSYYLLKTIKEFMNAVKVGDIIHFTDICPGGMDILEIINCFKDGNLRISFEEINPDHPNSEVEITNIYFEPMEEICFPDKLPNSTTKCCELEEKAMEAEIKITKIERSSL